MSTHHLVLSFEGKGYIMKKYLFFAAAIYMIVAAKPFIEDTVSSMKGHKSLVEQAVKDMH